jgi:peptide/nickel transport system substrate-binding protein
VGHSHAKRLALIAAFAVVAVAASAASAAHLKAGAGGTMVYAGASDPTYLDPAVVSDGESFRVTKQIFEGLVDLKPGTTTVIPKLAKSWSVSKNGKVWTFNLRKGIKFHDGTPFNASAVCFNFNRWYNFSGPFQDASATYYYQTVFQGFKKNESSTLGAPLYSGCKAKNATTAIVTLTKRNGPFLSSLVLSAFSMQSPTAIKKYDGNSATISNGVFRPTGSYAFEHPTGTGPYVFGGWNVKEKVTLNRNEKYWGKKAKLKTIIIRPISDNSARTQALQTGDIDMMDLLQPQDVPTVSSNSNLKVLNRPSFNVAYVTINQSKPPTNNLLVRKAIAYGLDRQSVVNSFYAGRAQVANEFQPPQLFGWSKNVVKYPYNPDKAKQLLQQAGLTLPVKIDFWYPTNVSRPYMPDPARNFQAFQASLEKSGFNVVPHSAPWRPDYRAGVQAGRQQVFLFGWIADFADPADFLNVHFGSKLAQFGFDNPSLFSELAKADAEPNYEKRVALYQQAGVDVMKFLPVVPYVWASSAVAVKSNVTGYIPGPIGPVNEPFAHVTVK